MMYSIDIFVNLNTAFYWKGALILNKKLIVKNYLKTSFIIDFCIIG